MGKGCPSPTSKDLDLLLADEELTEGRVSLSYSETPLISGEIHAGQASEETQIFRADRLNEFTIGPPSTVMASDLSPNDISTAHEARIAAQIASILPHLPQAL